MLLELDRRQGLEAKAGVAKAQAVGGQPRGAARVGLVNVYDRLDQTGKRAPIEEMGEDPGRTAAGLVEHVRRGPAPLLRKFGNLSV